jgi:hypothetical protein
VLPAGVNGGLSWVGAVGAERSRLKATIINQFNALRGAWRSTSMRGTARVDPAAWQISDIAFICKPKSLVSALAIMDTDYVPLAQRSADQLQTNADELRRMATTARTADVAKALLTLADRYAALAEQRRTEANR